MGEVSIIEWIILGALALGLVFLISVRVSISSIEARIHSLQKDLESRPAPSADAEGEQSPGSAFDQFLAEDPERLKLSKTDQFAAYREWRKVKGMNWSS